MRSFTINFILIILFGQITLAQTDSLYTSRIIRTNINYKSFTVIDNKLFAINDSGLLVIWDVSKLDTIHFEHNDTLFRYTAITKDKQNNIYIATNKGDIYKINPSDLSISFYLQDKYIVHAICINSENKMFLIVPSAVYEPSTKKHWSNFIHEKNGMIVRKKVGSNWVTTNTYFDIPQSIFLDSQDRIWMTSSFGEFGGSIQIFDTKKGKELNGKFDNIQMGLLFPKSVFNDDIGNIYITSGLQHFSNWGEIYKIDVERNVSKIYDSNDYRDTTKGNLRADGIFVGPGAYNKIDTSIYFATTQGFYKSRLPLSGKLQHPQLLFNPTMSWENEPLAIGVGMTVKKIEFMNDNKLLFLTSNDGFGIYDGQKLIFVK